MDRLTDLKVKNYDMVVQAERHQLAANQLRQRIGENQKVIMRLEQKELNKSKRSEKKEKKHGK